MTTKQRFTFADGITLLVSGIVADDMPRRDAERLAIRNLIMDEFGHDATIRHRDDGVPFIEGMHVSLSISHSADFACIAASSSRTVGVDIEQPRAQLRRIARRFLSEHELAVYRTDSMLLRAWTLKEALYKAALIPGLDFRHDIILPTDPSSKEATVIDKPFKIITIEESPQRTISLVAAIGNEP